MAGAILETAVLVEVFRTLVHRGENPRIYFWRTSSGTEVDFLIETGGRLIPIEVKLSATPRPSMANGIEAIRQDLGKRVVAPGFVIHPGDVEIAFSPSCKALPFARLWSF
jgi:predicted AAA+ superfamily ATPase